MRAPRLVVHAAAILVAAVGCSKPPPTTPPTDTPLDPNLPAQIEFPADQPEMADAEKDRETVNKFAWKTFVALNWPALPGTDRGVPDRDNPFRDTSGPTVWATWKSLEELYPESARPMPWATDDDHATVGVYDKQNDRKQYRLPVPAGTDPRRFKVLGALNHATTNINKPGPPLVDQNGNVVRYEVRLNQKAYESIHGKGLYLREKVEKLADNAGVFDDGSINIKAAWMELPEGKVDRGRYYHTTAQVVAGWDANKNAVFAERVVGLVGLHIVYKVESRASWVWATFEHVDNLDPPPGAAVASFRNPASTDAVNTSGTPHLVPGMTFPTTAVQAARVNKDFLPAAKTVNAMYQTHSAFAAGPWKYYQLVGVQWAREKGPDGLQDKGNIPVKDRILPKESVVNVTMETFIQGSSCLRCHGPSLSGRKFPFVFYPDHLALPTPLPKMP